MSRKKVEEIDRFGSVYSVMVLLEIQDVSRQKDVRGRFTTALLSSCHELNLNLQRIELLAVAKTVETVMVGQSSVNWSHHELRVSLQQG
jgi:hypothetical protein